MQIFNTLGEFAQTTKTTVTTAPKTKTFGGQLLDALKTSVVNAVPQVTQSLTARLPAGTNRTVTLPAGYNPAYIQTTPTLQGRLGGGSMSLIIVAIVIIIVAVFLLRK